MRSLPACLTRAGLQTHDMNSLQVADMVGRCVLVVVDEDRGVGHHSLHQHHRTNRGGASGECGSGIILNFPRTQMQCGTHHAPSTSPWKEDYNQMHTG